MEKLPLTNLELEKWKNLLLQLDISLKSFLGPDLYFDGKISELDLEIFRNFSLESGEGELEGELSIWKGEDFNQFENITNIRLPKEYKKFCEIFGGGLFGFGGIYIDCPDILSLGNYLESADSKMKCNPHQ